MATANAALHHHGRRYFAVDLADGDDHEQTERLLEQLDVAAEAAQHAHRTIEEIKRELRFPLGESTRIEEEQPDES